MEHLQEEGTVTSATELEGKGGWHKVGGGGGGGGGGRD